MDEIGEDVYVLLGRKHPLYRVVARSVAERFLSVPIYDPVSFEQSESCGRFVPESENEGEVDVCQIPRTPIFL